MNSRTFARVGKRRFRGPAPVTVVGLGLVALSAGLFADDLLDWQPIGRAGGVEAWSAQTTNGTVRILFRNTNEFPVSVQVARTLVWCGSREKGGGDPVETELGAFRLGPAQSRSSSGWNAICSKPEYFVEFRGIRIEARE